MQPHPCRCGQPSRMDGCLHLYTSTTETPGSHGRTRYVMTCTGCGIVLMDYEM